MCAYCNYAHVTLTSPAYLVANTCIAQIVTDFFLDVGTGRLRGITVKQGVLTRSSFTSRIDRRRQR